MKKEEEKKAFSMELPFELLDKIDHLAINRRTTRTALMKEIIGEYLAKREK